MTERGDQFILVFEINPIPSLLIDNQTDHKLSAGKALSDQNMPDKALSAFLIIRSNPFLLHVGKHLL
ncbi:unknown [Firmicutes bacterium CAG:534]|nr:unknown [Firmicutes bacterium CAG:534]